MIKKLIQMTKTTQNVITVQHPKTQATKIKMMNSGKRKVMILVKMEMLVLMMRRMGVILRIFMIGLERRIKEKSEIEMLEKTMAIEILLLIFGMGGMMMTIINRN